MKRIDMYITDSQEQIILQIKQENEELTKSDIVRNALNDYINKYKKKREQNNKE